MLNGSYWLIVRWKKILWIVSKDKIGFQCSQEKVYKSPRICGETDKLGDENRTMRCLNFVGRAETVKLFKNTTGIYLMRVKVLVRVTWPINPSWFINAGPVLYENCIITRTTKRNEVNSNILSS